MSTTDTGGRLGGTQSRMLIVELWLVWWEHSIYIWWEHVSIFRKVWMHLLHLCTSASWYIFLAKKAGANGECQQQVLQTKTLQKSGSRLPSWILHTQTYWHLVNSVWSLSKFWNEMIFHATSIPGKKHVSVLFQHNLAFSLSSKLFWHFQFVSLLLDLCRCRSPGRLLCRSQNPASGWSEQSDPAVIFQSPPSAKSTRSRRQVPRQQSLNLAVLNPWPWPHLCSYSPDSRRLGLLHFFLLPLKFPLLGLPEVPFWHFHLTCFIKMTPNKAYCRAQNCWALLALVP